MDIGRRREIGRAALRLPAIDDRRAACLERKRRLTELRVDPLWRIGISSARDQRQRVGREIAGPAQLHDDGQRIVIARFLDACRLHGRAARQDDIGGVQRKCTRVFEECQRQPIAAAGLAEHFQIVEAVDPRRLFDEIAALFGRR
jgi:hypothetical protein